jgi:hypothetical protein
MFCSEMKNSITIPFGLGAISIAIDFVSLFNSSLVMGAANHILLQR